MTDKNENIYFDFSNNFWCALWCPNATTVINKGIPRFEEVFNSCRPHHKKGNLIRGFLFCFVVDSRANMQIIAGSREKCPRTILRTVPCASNYKHGYNTHNPAAEPLRRSAPRGRYLSTAPRLDGNFDTRKASKLPSFYIKRQKAGF